MVRPCSPHPVRADDCGREPRDPDGAPIAETRHYLDDAEELLRTKKTAVDFFDAQIDRYPDHLGRMVLWVGAGALYDVRENPRKSHPDHSQRLAVVRRRTNPSRRSAARPARSTSRVQLGRLTPTGSRQHRYRPAGQGLSVSHLSTAAVAM